MEKPDDPFCYLTLAFPKVRYRFRVYCANGAIKPLMNSKFLTDLQHMLPGATKPKQLFKFNDIFINMGHIDSIQRGSLHNKLLQVCASNGYPRVENVN